MGLGRHLRLEGCICWLGRGTGASLLLYEMMIMMIIDIAAAADITLQVYSARLLDANALLRFRFER